MPGPAGHRQRRARRRHVQPPVGVKRVSEQRAGRARRRRGRGAGRAGPAGPPRRGARETSSGLIGELRPHALREARWAPRRCGSGQIGIAAASLPAGSALAGQELRCGHSGTARCKNPIGGNAMTKAIYTAEAHVTGGRAEGHGRTSDGSPGGRPAPAQGDGRRGRRHEPRGAFRGRICGLLRGRSGDGGSAREERRPATWRSTPR